MPNIVEVRGKGNVEFPDAMSDEQIASVIRSPKSGFLSNLGTSALRFGQGVVAPIVHPEETGAAVSDLFKGMAEKSGFAPGTVPHGQNVDALVKFYGDRYGSDGGLHKGPLDDTRG